MQKRGFTLIELLLAVVIISIGLIAVIEGVTRSMQLLKKTSNEVIAINLAREGMEAVYNIRNTNRLRRSGNRDGCRLSLDPASCGGAVMGSGTYIPQYDGSKWLLINTSGGGGAGALGSQTNPASSCLQIKTADESASTGLYRLQAGSMSSPGQYYCDMTTNGGGWMLLFQRAGGTRNRESCGNNLNEFLQNNCGSVANLAYGDSYSSDVTQTLSNFGVAEYLNIQYNAGMSPDTDDAYVIKTSSNIFPNSTGRVEDIAVEAICDINGANCDTTDTYWRYVGDSFYSSTQCHRGYAPKTAYNPPLVGMYGYCHNGLTTPTYYSNSLFGNRSAYNEAKLWRHAGGSRTYAERVFIRPGGVGGVAGEGYELCKKNGQYVYDPSCPDDQISHFSRTIIGKGLRNKRTGSSIICDGTETSGVCVDDTPKEYRFCSRVVNPTGIPVDVEMCGLITNFVE